MLVHAKAMGPDFTFFVVYGPVNHLVDLLGGAGASSASTRCSPPRRSTRAIKRRLRRKLVVVGACIGTDAHTVGIDAILNIKGFAGEKGLEYYREIKVVNLGAQVLVPELVARARAEKADAVLVSQVVTQRDAHLHNTREMSAAFREAYPAGSAPLLVVGGPRFDELADRRARRRPHLRPRARRPARWRATSCTPSTDPATDRRREDRHDRRPTRVGLTVTHRRYVPYSHAHYAGNLVDGAYVARPVRRRRDRGVHPHRRRRGAVRVVLRRAVPRAGAGRRRGRGRRRR